MPHLQTLVLGIGIQESEENMTKDQAVSTLNAIGFPASSDEEADHQNADDILVKFLRANGHKDVADAWERARDRVGFWYA